MFWLIGCGFILFLCVINRAKTHSLPGRCENNVDRKHKWVIRFDNGDRKGYLICKICGKVPGEE